MTWLSCDHHTCPHAPIEQHKMPSKALNTSIKVRNKHADIDLHLSCKNMIRCLILFANTRSTSNFLLPRYSKYSVSQQFALSISITIFLVMLGSTKTSKYIDPLNIFASVVANFDKALTKVLFFNWHPRVNNRQSNAIMIKLLINTSSIVHLEPHICLEYT